MGSKRKICPWQFVLPLFYEIAFQPLKRGRGRPKGVRNQPKSNNIDWPVEEAACKLSDAVMEDALTLLRSYQAPIEEKREAYDWVCQPIVFTGNPLPFSFQDCAVRLGLDPESLQELLIHEVQSQGFLETEEEKTEAAAVAFREEIIEAVLFGIEYEARHPAGEIEVAIEAA